MKGKYFEFFVLEHRRCTLACAYVHGINGHVNHEVRLIGYSAVIG